MDNPRKLAHLSLVKSDTQECYTNIEINTVLSRARLEKSDSALYTFLYLGVTEKKLLLDHVIGQYSKIPLSEIDVEAKNAARLGIYQLLFTDRIPDYSAVDQSVELAPKRAKGFVNAILRSFLRNGKKIDYPSDEWERLSIQASVPMEIAELFRVSYGDAVAKELCSYTERDFSLSLRVNTLKTSVQDVLATLTERGYEPRMSEYGCGIVKCAVPVSEIKDLIDKGEAFVQDESSYICALTLGAMPGERVADVCACPGGKTFSTAVEMGNEGEIRAYDLHENKLSLIQKGAKRLGIDIVTVAQQNARVFVPENESAFDRVLCDVPCSGLGVIFKKPDIKYKSIDSIKSLPPIQYEILENCSRYVKKGGYLVYSTCTLCKDENENNVSRFLSEHREFEAVDFELGSVRSQNGTYTFMPHITGTDGFFVAKLRRVK